MTRFLALLSRKTFLTCMAVTASLSTVIAEDAFATAVPAVIPTFPDPSCPVPWTVPEANSTLKDLSCSLPKKLTPEQCASDSRLELSKGNCSLISGQAAPQVSCGDASDGTKSVFDPASAKCVAKKAAATNCGKNTKPGPSDASICVPDVGTFFSGWGIGIAMLKNTTRQYTDGTVVGTGSSAIVRATSIQSTAAELVFARHFYSDSSCKHLPACLGPFVSVGLNSGNTTSQIIDMVGLGGVVGFGSDSQRKETNPPFNVGLGWGRRFGVKSFGPGFADGMPPPAGETQIRYRTQDISALFVFFTYAWED